MSQDRPVVTALRRMVPFFIALVASLSITVIGGMGTLSAKTVIADEDVQCVANTIATSTSNQGTKTLVFGSCKNYFERSIKLIEIDGATAPKATAYICIAKTTRPRNGKARVIEMPHHCVPK